MKGKAAELVRLVIEDRSRKATMKLLEQAKERAQEYATPLTDIMADSDQDREARLAAIRLLGSLPCSQAVDAILRDYLVLPERSELRMEAVKALTAIGGFGAFDALLSLLDLETDPDTKRLVADSLTTVAEEKDLPRLEAALARHDLFSRSETSERIARVGGRKPTTDQLVEIAKVDASDAEGRGHLEKFLRDSPESAIQTAAIQKLAASENKEAIKILARWASEVPDRREERTAVDAALVALARIKDAELRMMIDGHFEKPDSNPLQAKRLERLRQCRRAFETHR